MRFITECVQPNIEIEHHYAPDQALKYRKESCAAKLGALISESFGWENPNGTAQHHRLEIEAFPMDKWIEIRNKIIEKSKRGRSNRTNNIIQLFKELESFGKQENTNQQLTNGTE